MSQSVEHETNQSLEAYLQEYKTKCMENCTNYQSWLQGCKATDATKLKVRSSIKQNYIPKDKTHQNTQLCQIASIMKLMETLMFSSCSVEPLDGTSFFVLVLDSVGFHTSNTLLLPEFNLGLSAGHIVSPNYSEDFVRMRMELTDSPIKDVHLIHRMLSSAINVSFDGPLFKILYLDYTCSFTSSSKVNPRKDIETLFCKKLFHGLSVLALTYTRSGKGGIFDHISQSYKYVLSQAKQHNYVAMQSHLNIYDMAYQSLPIEEANKSPKAMVMIFQVFFVIDQELLQKCYNTSNLISPVLRQCPDSTILLKILESKSMYKNDEKKEPLTVDVDEKKEPLTVDVDEKKEPLTVVDEKKQPQVQLLKINDDSNTKRGKRNCGKCGEPGHYRTTCDRRQIPISSASA